MNEYLTVSVSSGTGSSWTAFFKFMFNKTRYYYYFFFFTANTVSWLDKKTFSNISE